jgi:hypothetical protein
MTRRTQSTGIGLLPIFLVLFVCAQSNSRISDAVNGDQGTLSLKWGEVQNTGVESVSLNDIAVPSGTSIPPDSHLKTLEGACGTIILGDLGKVTLSQSTKLSLAFDEHRLDVKLEKGCTTITVAPGKSGVVDAAGRHYTFGPEEHSPVKVCLNADGGSTTLTDVATDEDSRWTKQLENYQVVTPFMFALGIRSSIPEQGELRKGNRPEPFGSSLPAQ